MCCWVKADRIFFSFSRAIKVALYIWSNVWKERVAGRGFFFFPERRAPSSAEEASRNTESELRSGKRYEVCGYPFFFSFFSSFPIRLLFPSFSLFGQRSSRAAKIVVKFQEVSLFSCSSRWQIHSNPLIRNCSALCLSYTHTHTHNVWQKGRARCKRNRSTRNALAVHYARAGPWEARDRRKQSAPRW